MCNVRAHTSRRLRSSASEKAITDMFRMPSERCRHAWFAYRSGLSYRNSIRNDIQANAIILRIIASTKAKREPRTLAEFDTRNLNEYDSVCGPCEGRTVL